MIRFSKDKEIRNLTLTVALGSSLSRQHQCRGSVITRHVELNKAELLTNVEALVSEQLVELILGLDLVSLVLLGLATEGSREILVVPVLDVIVDGIPTVDATLNCVAIVADDEDDGVEVLADHGADFLGGQLEGTVTSEENGTLATKLLGGEGSTLQTASGVTNGAPEHLRDGSDTLGEASLPDTEVGSTGLGDDDIVLAQPLANARPEPSLGDGGVGALSNLLGDSVVGDGTTLDVELSELSGNLRQDTVHAHTGVLGVFDGDTIAVEIDGVELGCPVGEASGVEVGLDGTNADDKIGGFDTLADTGVGTVTCVHTTVVGKGLVDSALTHGSNKSGDAGLSDQLVGLLQSTVPDCASIDKDDRVLSSVKVLEDNIDDIVLLLLRVGRPLEVQGGLQPLTLDLLLDDIGRQSDVDRTREHVALLNGVVDQGSSLVGVIEHGNRARDLAAHVGKGVEVAIAQGVVEQEVVLLGRGGGVSDDVDDGNEFRVGTSKGVDGRELTDTEGGDNGRDALNSGVAIGGVACRKLVAGFRSSRVGEEGQI